MVAPFNTYDFYTALGPPPSDLIENLPSVAAAIAGVWFAPPLGDLLVSVSDDTPAYLYYTSLVSQNFTLEWNVILHEIPTDFTHLSSNHLFLGSMNASGPCAGIFISKVGIMYAGAVFHNIAGDLLVGSATQIIPDSYKYISLNTKLNFRMAVSSVIGALYLFVGPAVEPPGVQTYPLRVVVPLIDSSLIAFATSDQTVISLRGTNASPTRVEFDRLAMADSALIPNILPVADAGNDQAVRTCSIVKLDGSGSFDPEGAPLSYQWYLTDAPIGSSHAVEADDGVTVDGIDPLVLDELVNEIQSSTLGLVHAVDPILPGDIVQLNGTASVIVSAGGAPFTIQVATSDFVENQTNLSFKVLRQRGIQDPTTVSPSFFPDKPGFYAFELLVNDGQNPSEASQTIVNVLESPLPRGCTPDLSFIFGYLGDFWKLVEEKEPIATIWSAIAQVTASELYTLWQTDYSKSIRDIQRQFIRRWLHYDLLLAEPLPELTSIRAVWAGITTSLIPAVGVAPVSTKTIELEFLDEKVSYTFTGADPYTPLELYWELVGALSRYGFVIDHFEDRTTGPAPFAEYIRINAPFPFTVTDASTLSSVILDPTTSSYPQGTAGAGVAQSTYRVDTSLEALDIQENDILIVDGVGYRILNKQDVSLDDLPCQRLVLKDPLPVTIGTEWCIGAVVTSKILDFYSGLVSKDDHVYFEVADILKEEAPVQALFEIVRSSVLGACEALPSSLVVDPGPIGDYLYNEGAAVRLAKIVRRTYVPRSSLVQDIPLLSEKIVITDEESVLRRNLDYFLEEYRGISCIRFITDLSGIDVWEKAVPPERMWAEYSYLDNRPRIEANFGIPADFTLDDLSKLSEDVDYLSAVRGLWYAYTHSPTLYNLRIGVQILLGLPFAEEEGTIEEIRTDFSPNKGRILIRDKFNSEIVRSYDFPSSLKMEVDFTTGVQWKVGDVVPQFAPLVTGVEVTDYIKNPKWFETYLNQGQFKEVEKFFRFLVRADSSVFNLSALIFAHEFVLRVKPTYTYPKLLVLLHSMDTTIELADEKVTNVSLLLAETPCDGWYGSTTMWDDPRAARGGWRSQHDRNALPLDFPDPDPAYIPGAPPRYGADWGIKWGYDKAYTCPEDHIYSVESRMLAVPTVITPPVGGFRAGPLVSCVTFSAPPAPLPQALPPIPGCPANSVLDGYLAFVRILVLGFSGVPGANGYGVTVTIDGDPVWFPFDSALPNFEFFTVFVVGLIPVDGGDALAAIVSNTSGPSPPTWTSITVDLFISDTVPWNFLVPVPAGKWAQVRGPM
jgi:hypothetical protein